MRTFGIEVIVHGGNVVIGYPYPTAWNHNGFGGGTDTPAPTKAEAREIIKLLKGLLAELRKRKEVEMPKE